MDNGRVVKPKIKDIRGVQRQRPHRISASFIGLCAVWGLSGIVLYEGLPLAQLIAPFVFVVSGWIIALCLHEFGHALVAYRGGETGVAQTGYLSLDPLSYTHPINSIILPVVFILCGFLALPGGAVFVRTGLLRNRYWESATSAAGPLMTLFCLCAICIPFTLGLHMQGGTPAFWTSMGALAGLLAMALVWNLLPIPGLDGWGIIEPFLSPEIRSACVQWRQVGPLLLIAAVVMFRPLGHLILKTELYILAFMDVPVNYFFIGLNAIRFWNFMF